MKTLRFTLFSLLLIYSVSYSQINFRAKSLNNDEIELAQVLKSGPVLINFWATWCQPCKAEMKNLKRLYEKYSEKGFTIIGINLDSPKSSAKVRSFISSQKIMYPVILDTNNEIFNKFNGQVVPYSLLFDKNGSLAYKHTGYLPGDEEKFENEIQKLLE